MKTIAELSVEYGIDRSTLLKAAKRSEERDGVQAWARKSGDIYLLNEESEGFKTWLTSRKRRTPSPKKRKTERIFN